MPEKAHKHKEKRELSYLSRFPIFMETVGLEHNDNPLFKPFDDSLVAYGLHESTKRAPEEITLPGCLCAQRCSSRLFNFFARRIKDLVSGMLRGKCSRVLKIGKCADLAPCIIP